MSHGHLHARRRLAHPGLSSSLTRVVDDLPGVGDALWRVARRYVGGRDLAEAEQCARRLVAQGCQVSLDLFGVRAGEPAVGSVTDSYVALSRATAAWNTDVWLSVDPSRLALHESWSTGVRSLERIAGSLAQGCRLQVGAESERSAECTLQAVLKLAEAGLPVMATLQANLRRSHDDAERLATAGVPVRLVKGAFIESPRVSWRTPEQIDASFVHIARSLCSSGAEVSLATHDRELREELLLSLGPLACEVGLGVRPQDLDELVRCEISTRIYMPYGPEWLHFYLRRLAEAPPRAVRGAR
ncbi:proline dehydrogenase family protein [Streptomyces sp. NPDC060022]|uniref:proline dehydrogenase family protein n=1 Tax=Streptomyces sp. NPDC060022 TaxID=3347039 RepID=UPI0036AB602F